MAGGDHEGQQDSAEDRGDHAEFVGRTQRPDQQPGGLAGREMKTVVLLLDRCDRAGFEVEFEDGGAGEQEGRGCAANRVPRGRQQGRESLRCRRSAGRCSRIA